MTDSTAIETDWQLRSLTLKKLTSQATPDRPVALGSSPVPRVLVQYWDEREVPDDVTKCLASWGSLESLGSCSIAIVAATSFFMRTATNMRPPSMPHPITPPEATTSASVISPSKADGTWTPTTSSRMQTLAPSCRLEDFACRHSATTSMPATRLIPVRLCRAATPETLLHPHTRHTL